MGRRVLFGVLNWGLGHASRSSVLIRALESASFEVFIASDGAAGEWLQAEFPHLNYLDLPSYRISYSKGAKQWPKLLASLPRMAKAASAERQRILKWQEEYDFCGIISDNRLGFYHPHVPSIYLSHQLAPEASFATWFAAKAHAWYFKKFDALWVPDKPLYPLSSRLVRASKQAKPIGILSALERKEASEFIPALIVLSGPEPQRSILEAKILAQADALPENSVLVRGTDTFFDNSAPKHMQVYNRLGSTEMSRLLAQANFMISRSGYSSLMDYRYLGKRALLIPTPGQYEQEYLAEVHHGCYGWIRQNQAKLNLKEGLKELAMQEPPEVWDINLPADLFKPFLK